MDSYSIHRLSHVQNVDQEKAEAQSCVCARTCQMKSNEFQPGIRQSTQDNKIKRKKKNGFDKMLLFTIYNKIIVRRKKIQSLMKSTHIQTRVQRLAVMLEAYEMLWSARSRALSENRKKSHTSKELSGHEFRVFFFSPTTRRFCSSRIVSEHSTCPIVHISNALL